MSSKVQPAANADAVHMTGYRYLAEVQAQAVAFVTLRTGENLALGAELLGCRNPTQMRDLSGRYLGAAFEQYCAATAQQIRLNRAALDGMTGTGQRI